MEDFAKEETDRVFVEECERVEGQASVEDKAEEVMKLRMERHRTLNVFLASGFTRVLLGGAMGIRQLSQAYLE